MLTLLALASDKKEKRVFSCIYYSFVIMKWFLILHCSLGILLYKIFLEVLNQMYN